MDKKEQWNNLYEELKEAYFDGETEAIDNMGSFHPDCLKELPLEKLELMLDRIQDHRDAIHTFNSLQNEVGWEHVWED